MDFHLKVVQETTEKFHLMNFYPFFRKQAIENSTNFSENGNEVYNFLSILMGDRFENYSLGKEFVYSG